jgi:hypothetical protein
VTTRRIQSQLAAAARARAAPVAEPKAKRIAELAVGDFSPSVEAELAGKQDVLVSGVSLKTVNGSSLLGSGNLSIAGTGSSGSIGFDDNLGVWIMDEGEL